MRAQTIHFHPTSTNRTIHGRRRRVGRRTRRALRFGARGARRQRGDRLERDRRRAHHRAAGQPPHVAALSLAMVQGAVYDAVNAIDGGHQPYLVAPPADPRTRRTPRSRPRPSACSSGCSRRSIDAAAALRRLARGGARRAGEGRRDRGRRGRGRGDARRAGERRPRRPVHLRRGHRSWRVAAAAAQLRASTRPPWVGNVRPFLVPNVEMLRTDGPNALTSAAYAEDFNEIKGLGSLTSTKRTADQTAAAIFWQDSGPAIWNRVFRAARGERGARHRRQRPPVRDDEPGRGRRSRSAAGTTSPTGASGGRSRRSARRRTTATRRPRPTRTGCRCSTRLCPSPGRRS